MISIFKTVESYSSDKLKKIRNFYKFALVIAVSLSALVFCKSDISLALICLSLELLLLTRMYLRSKKRVLISLRARFGLDVVLDKPQKCIRLEQNGVATVISTGKIENVKELPDGGCVLILKDYDNIELSDFINQESLNNELREIVASNCL